MSEQQTAPVPVMAPSVLLMGDINCGKTFTVHSLVAAGMEVFYLGCEPGFEELLGSIPSNKLHWNYVAPFRDDMKVTMKKVEMVRDYTDAQLKAMGGVEKQKHTQLLDIMKLCNNFVDLRTGEAFGDVANWDVNRCLFVDGLSGLSQMAIKVKIGDKPFMEQNDYYAVQQMLRDFINTLTTNTRCLFVLTAHIEYEPDPVQSINKIMPSTVGQKLAPEISRYFSDAILCKRKAMKDAQGNVSFKFYWDNIDPAAKVKFRNLPPSENLPADFAPLIQNWRKKAGVA